MTDLSTPSAGCGDMAEAIPVKPQQIIRLASFAPPTTTAERFQNTADYVRNPQAYLERMLGKETLEARRDLIHISSDYDKDVYGARGHKPHFEQHIAKTLGKKHGLFFITGVQAQLVALKIYCDRAKNTKIAWHVTSHLEMAEERAFEELYGLQRELIGKDERTLPSVDEVLAVIHSYKPAAILLEVPSKMLGCATWTYDELKQVSDACRQHNVILHMDGARFWDVMPYYEEQSRSVADVTSLFDSMYVSMYKGLEGVTGAMLVTDDSALISEAKAWQRRAGGNPYTLIYETVDCERGFNENIGTFASKWQKMIEVTSAITKATSTFKNLEGRKIVSFSPETPVCCQIRTTFDGYTLKQLNEARDSTEAGLHVRVFESIMSKYTLDEKLAADRSGKSLEECFGNRDSKQYDVGWTITTETERIDTSVFVEAYVHFCQALQDMN